MNGNVRAWALGLAGLLQFSGVTFAATGGNASGMPAGPAPPAGYAAAQPGQAAKYSQPMDCEETCYFSNINSNVTPYVRYDDFTCNATGYIVQTVFWGSGWNVRSGIPCKTFENVAGFQIDFFEWVEDPLCSWRPGNLLCSNTVAIEDVLTRLECPDPFGGEYHSVVAPLSQACFQTAGQRLALRISAILEDPANPCVFSWSASPDQIRRPGFSEDRNTGEICIVPQDMAFELITNRRFVKYAQDPGCESTWGDYSNLGSNVFQYLRYDDFVCTATGNISELIFWGSAWDFVQRVPCNLSDNIAGFKIEIYEWAEGGRCGWQPGKLLMSEQFLLDELAPVIDCQDVTGAPVYRMTADFTDPPFQISGRHYALCIAGIVEDPDDPCLFLWHNTPGKVRRQAYSFNPVDGKSTCAGPDQAFALLTDTDDVVKYAQLNACEGARHSNLNSNASPRLHHDDFVCTQSGLINTVAWWGTPSTSGCDTNILGFEINIYEWQEDDTAACLWRPGALLCSNFVELGDTNAQLECTGPGGEKHYRFEAQLTEPCFQHFGRHYVLRIAALLRDPNGCFWSWSRSLDQIGSVSMSVDRNTGDQFCITPDAAFEMFTSSCRVHYAEFGVGLAGSGGYVPRAYGTDGTCDEGGHSLHVDQALGGTLAVFWAGMAQDNTPFYGGTLYVDLGLPFTLFPFILSGRPGLPGAGFFDLPGIDLSGLVGLTATMQFSIADPAAIQGISLSNGVRIEVIY